MKSFTTLLDTIGEIGIVRAVSPSLVLVEGLPGATVGEVVVFEDGERGYVLSLLEDEVEVLLFSNDAIKTGSKATRTGEVVALPLTLKLLGKTIDPLGRDLHEGSVVKGDEYRLVDIEAQGIATRVRISKMLATGTTLVDSILPLGHGQRQLVIGDRKTGKTNFLLRSIVYQASLGTVCIYAGIGKKRQDIKKVETFLEKHKALHKTTILTSFSDDPAGVIFLTPFAAMTLAEYYRDQGSDVLLVLDDMTTHAKYYREISLLGKRFPGRNAYPADSFHTHARLLERAGNFKIGKDIRSITCLPVAETAQADLTGYIQTNLMSMTDGHLYFDSELFTQGQRPAINPFLSVTRVGRQTQSNVKRETIRELTSFLSSTHKLQQISHFGQEMTQEVKNMLTKAEQIFLLFGESSHTFTAPALQFFLLCLIWDGYFLSQEQETLRNRIQSYIKLFENDKTFKEQLLSLESAGKTFPESVRLAVSIAENFIKSE